MAIISQIIRIPMDLTKKVLEGIVKQVDEGMLRTEESVLKKIMEVQMKYENGVLEENEYREVMNILGDRLKEIRGK